MSAGLSPVADPNCLTTADVDALLRRIIAGEISWVAIDESWDDACGNIEFRTSDGWSIVVFNDVGEWDYLDSVLSPDGRAIGFADLYLTNRGTGRVGIVPLTAELNHRADLERLAQHAPVVARG